MLTEEEIDEYIEKARSALQFEMSNVEENLKSESPRWLSGVIYGLRIAKGETDETEETESEE